MAHPRRPVVLVAGGGVAALEAVLALRVLAGPALELELLAPGEHFVYRPGAVMIPFGRGEARRVPLATLADDQSLTLRRAALAGVDPARRIATTDAGKELSWDVLLVALGAVPKPALPGALTFTGPHDALAMRRMLDELRSGEARSIAFALPLGTSWPLPLYELALMTQAALAADGVSDIEITVVTHEERPLEMFGSRASDDLEELLERRGIVVRGLSHALELKDGRLRLEGGGSVSAQRAVALPRLEGPRVPGLPSDYDGFLATDDHGRVNGVEAVYAAGDCTAFPLKQGGIASQQADAAASAIAAACGAPVQPEPFRPLLRGMLLTGSAPRYLRADPTRLASASSVAIEAPSRRGGSEQPEHGDVAHRALWWPPSKVAGRYLAPYLADARPVPLASAPLADRVAPVRPADRKADAERQEAAELALAMADGDARFGDFAGALHALAAAESIIGSLPPEYAEKRRIWRDELHDGQVSA